MARDKDDSGSGISGKRDKSWREIDARGGKSKYGSRQDDPKAQKVEKSASYEKYKKAADSLFTGGALPQGLAETFDPDGKRKAQAEAMLKIREAPDRKAWVAGIVEFVQNYPALPEDAYFLNDLLDHPKDRIVDKSLSKLEALHGEGKLKAGKIPPSLKQRLTALELTSMDTDIKARAKALKSALF